MQLTDPLGLLDDDSGVCKVENFDVEVMPVQYRRLVDDGTFGPKINVTAKFGDDGTGDVCCGCCEYRQYVGTITMKHQIIFNGTPLGQDIYPGGWILSAWENQAEVEEDCVGSWCPGYRGKNQCKKDDEGRFIDCYLPNRLTGCEYKTMDWPGPHGLNKWFRLYHSEIEAGAVLQVRVVGSMRFVFEIVDVCNGSQVRERIIKDLDYDEIYP